MGKVPELYKERQDDKTYIFLSYTLSSFYSSAER